MPLTVPYSTLLLTCGIGDARYLDKLDKKRGKKNRPQSAKLFIYLSLLSIHWYDIYHNLLLLYWYDIVVKGSQSQRSLVRPRSIGRYGRQTTNI